MFEEKLNTIVGCSKYLNNKTHVIEMVDLLEIGTAQPSLR